MLITVQAVPERMLWVESEIITKFQNSEVHVFQDKNYHGTEWSFKNMLGYKVEDYRLHIQDDVILHPNIEQLSLELTKQMTEKTIHVLSLFVPFYFKIPEDFTHGVLEYKNYSWLQATIFSKSFVQLMRIEKDKITGIEDDKFVQEVAKKHKIKTYVHCPSLCQHKIDQKTIVGNQNNETQRINRTTKHFDIDFTL
jgi:hypothetical protein